MQIRYVNTASTAGGDGTTNGTAGATRAYVSLNAALTALPGTLTDAYTIYCDGSGGADTTANFQTPFNHTTSAANYILITTQGGQRHTGTYNTSIYRLEITNNNALYNNLAEHLRIDCIQIKLTISDGASYIGIKTTNANQTVSDIDCRVTNCIVKGNVTSGNAAGYELSTTSGTVTTGVVANCIAMDCTSGFLATLNGARFYNCGAYNCGSGFSDTASKMLVKNCLGYNCTASFQPPFFAGSDYNSENNRSGVPPGTHSYYGYEFNFSNAGSEDFHLTVNDQGARRKGADLSADSYYAFSTDIDDATRSGLWDIGPDQYTAAQTGIHIGAASKKITTSGGEVNPHSTVPVTTTTGSTFVVAMCILDSATITSFADTIGGSASGNTWTQLGTEIDSGTGAADGGRLRIYYCQNGNGGVDHVFSVTTSISVFASTWAIEIASAATASFDKSVSLVHDVSSPFNSGSTSTTAQATELAIGVALAFNDSGTGNAVITSSGSSPADANWAIAIEEKDSTQFFTGGMMFAPLSSTGTYNFSYTAGDATDGYAAILTFKEVVTAVMGTAFQVTAFQANAFQIFGGTPAVTGTWKTTVGLAKGSHKTVLGLAQASIKTFDQLTN